MVASPQPLRPLPQQSMPPAWRSASTDLAPATATTAVVKFPKLTRLPVWLRIFFVMQQGSSLMTFCLATAVLIAYGSTVYVQQEWSAEYRKLEQLQRERRELTAANELVKNQLAQQASRPDAGLMVPSPANTIFLPKANGRSFSQPPQMTTPLSEVASKAPMGY